MNESIYEGIPELDLKPDVYGVVISFYDKRQKPIVMRLEDWYLEVLKGAYLHRFEDNSSVIIKDFTTGYQVALDVKDVGIYVSKKLDRADMDFSWRIFIDWVDTFIELDEEE